MQMNFAGQAQIRRAIHGARSEVLLAVPGEGPLEDQVDVTAAHGMTGSAGVSVKMYVPAAARGTDRLPERQLAALARRGVEIHSTPGRSPRMVIIDRSVVVLARNEEDYSEGALIGHSLPFTPMLVHSLTASAPNGPEDRPVPEEALTALDREVLRQLALGTKDETAAREMGLALRTYRRMVARLMDSLDARSRFQAGYLAGQRGLLQ
ncbi:hypothetical protein ACIA6C_23410 [Streptomyces sp. NPDC051578]|uniref:hypothetical protein n=1 Tax=Streptomyces sp. NPDC051578 TaxID=3365662 RepID=UPI0037B80F8D